jgi:hypothetical protein
MQIVPNVFYFDNFSCTIKYELSRQFKLTMLELLEYSFSPEMKVQQFAFYKDCRAEIICQEV